MILDKTTISLQAALAGAVSASEPEIHVDYLVWNNEGLPTKPASTRSVMTGATDVTILAAPTTQGYVHEPVGISIYNKDTASVVVTVKTDDGTERIIIKKTLTTLQSLCWDKNVGWYVI